MRKGFLRSRFSVNASRFKAKALKGHIQTVGLNCVSSEKGFIFSIDALLAIALIVSASLAFVFLVPKADSELLNVQMLRIKANDTAIVSFYTGTAGNSNSNLTSNASIGYCAQKFKYNLALPSNNVVKEYYCEEN